MYHCLVIYLVSSTNQIYHLVASRLGDKFDWSMTLGKLLDNNAQLFICISSIWSLPPTNVKWHFDSRPVHNRYTVFYLHRIRVISMEHLQRVCHANRERLPLQTRCCVSFRTCFVCSNGWNQLSRIRLVFSRLYTLNISCTFSILFLNFFYIAKLKQFKNTYGRRFYKLKWMLLRNPNNYNFNQF